METEVTQGQRLIRELGRIWADFESRLVQVAIISRALRGSIRLEDYRQLLHDHYQQVLDGACWISRAASSLDRQHLRLRSQFLRHAGTEHRDYLMLEQDFQAVGGDLQALRNGRKNIGASALSAWMMQRATQPNPVDLLGSMFIIEGLGKHFAGIFASALQRHLQLREDQVSFYRYHAEHDEDHLQQLLDLFETELLDSPRVAERIARTARVTGRLYLLQLEELGNY
ncbi:iron-containing redox enzyme family protein [Microbulbifer yueqingensis]|uniref:3-oxoacyl-[acyl-carrier-protein] synthase-3 n=1 Tax=Microbulbifer yueqingensis TaxID=658219 RepID=A0A1G9CRE8_9GAMM|nr:iron-containing redox enzyme family protein [Microbulbifer yueqingensis]SDK54250.1 3-oxoacyl-[acyl-carrier-protein] synthase-3 [Microbulbifer yueqingensis]